MRVGYSFANPQKEVELPAQIECGGIDIDRRAVDVIHHQVRCAIRGLARVQQTGDAGVLERSENLAFLEKAVVEGAPFHILPQQLDGDTLLDLSVDALGEEHRARASTAQKGNEAIR